MHIISIGKDCGVSIALRNLGLRKLAYPWDWARYTQVTDIIDVIQRKDTFVVEEWKNLQNIHEFLPHDRPGDSHGETENRFENATLLEKYKRRFERFFQHIQEPDTYLVRFGPPSDIPHLNTLSQLIPHVKIVFIENGEDSDEHTYQTLKTIFTQDKDETYLFLDQMMTIYNDSHVSYPSRVEDLVQTMNQRGIAEKYIHYIAKYKPETVFHEKSDLLHYVYMALKQNGFEYSIF